MEEKIRLFREPTHVPRGWIFTIIGVALGCISYAFMTGSWKSEMEVRAATIEARQVRLADAYLRQDTKLDSLLERTSRIEGQNELILRRMSR